MIPRKPSWMLLAYFALAVIFMLCAVVANRTGTLEYNLASGGWTMQTDLQWLFWLFFALGVFCLLPLFSRLLAAIARRNLLPQPLTNLILGESEIAPTFGPLKQRIGRLSGRLTMAGLAIFGTIFILSKSNAVLELEIDNYVYEYLGGRLVGRVHSPVNAQPISVALRVNLQGNDDSANLRDMLKIVQDLKSVGASAILVDFRKMADLIKNYEVIRQIEESDISVFGMTESSARFVDFSQLNTKDPRGELKVSKGAMTLNSSEFGRYPFLFRFRPELDILGAGNFLDITLELLRKYHHYPREMAVVKSGNSIVFGDYRIPLGRDGCAYARQSPLVWFNPKVGVTRNGSGDTLKYESWMKNQSKGPVSTIQDFRDVFNGKIVFLERSDMMGPVYNWMLIDTYRSAIQAIEEGTLIARSHTLHVWVTLLCIVLAGLIAFRLWSLSAMLSIFGLGCVVLISCWFVYHQLNVLIDIFYPLLSIGMSMFIFPAITVAEKMEETGK